MAWQEFPMITYPHCKKRLQVESDHYYDFKAGDTFECPKCEKTIHIWQTDWTLSADIQVSPEK